MANPAKRKGDAAELEAARLLADLTGWPVRRRLGAGRLDDTGDLDGIPDTTVGVKAYKDIQRAIRETLDELPTQQANADATFGFGMIRRPGGRWFAVLTIDQIATLLREATQPDRCRVFPNGSISHKWACDFGDDCPGSHLPPHPDAKRQETA